MEFRDFTDKDIIPAAILLANRHKRERIFYPSLNKKFENFLTTKKILTKIFNSEFVIGVCAYDNETLNGFLLATITDTPLGRSACIDYEGLAIIDNESAELYRLLYQYLGTKLVEKGVLTHYVYVPTGSNDVINAWLNLSFSYQQAYGIKNLVDIPNPNLENYEIRLATDDDINMFDEISNLIYEHIAASPVFAIGLPERISQIKKNFKELTTDQDSILYLAFHQNELVGYSCLNLYIDSTNMMMPTKAIELSIQAVKKEYRNKGIGHMLFNNVVNKALSLNYHNMILDWRIASLSSSNFWKKQGFIPIVFRMVRTIDPRIYWANGINTK